MSDHISSDPRWPSYKVDSSYLSALAPFLLGLWPFSPISFDPLWVGRQRCGKLLKREKGIILKPALETWTEYRLKSTKSSPGFSLSIAEIIFM